MLSGVVCPGIERPRKEMFDMTIFFCCFFVCFCGRSLLMGTIVSCFYNLYVVFVTGASRSFLERYFVFV